MGTTEADADLKDLLAADGSSKSEMQPLNLDNLSKGELDVPVNKGQSMGGPPCSCFTLICLYISYACEYAPGFCWTIGCVALIVPAYFLIVAVFLDPTQHFGTIAHDYTSAQSVYDLTIGDIDHWCLSGDNDSCRCEDPLIPAPKLEYKQWAKAHKTNKKMVGKMIEQGTASPDIAFFGDSVIEEMDGRWFGDERDDQLKDLQKMFKKNFDKNRGGKVDAVALGIAGDTSPSILWRLKNGEMPDDFNPKIWWLELGANDLARTQCSEEVVVLGILRVVEEILQSKPQARVVINTLFPMSSLRVGLAPKADAFKTDAQKIEEVKKMRAEKRAEGRGVFGNAKRAKADRRNRDGDGERRLDMDGEVLDYDENVRKLRFSDIEKPQKREQKGFRGRAVDRKPVKISDHKTTQKKFNPITHKQKSLPLWTSITAINKELKKFCKKNDRVDCFDSTEVFASKDGDYWVLDTDMISRRGHPTPEGYGRWETKVVSRATHILEDMGYL